MRTPRKGPRLSWCFVLGRNRVRPRRNEAINLVAQSWGRQNIGKDDEIVITWLEHHANIVPWQQLCTETGAVLKVVPVDDHGQVRLDAYEKLLGPRTKLVSFTEVRTRSAR